MPYSPAASSTSRKTNGFTLVEILVVVPVVVLVVAVLVGFLVTLTGDALMSRERTEMVYTTQDALNQIEQDIRVSTRFMTTTGTLPSPLGSNSGTAAFASPSTQLIMEQYATIGSPYEGTRQLAYYANRPNICNDYHEYNEPVTTMIVYFVDNGDLRRRTISSPSGTMCGATAASLWQISSCKAEPNKTTCLTRDSILATNVSSFSLEYFNTPDGTSPLNLSTNPGASTATATLNISKSVAGEAIQHSGTMRATRLNQSQAWVDL